jgi:hypothetical protein
LDYTGWLQDVDEETDEPYCHPRTVAKQLSGLRGFARWLSVVPELRVDPRIQHIPVKAGPAPAPRALAPEQLRPAAGHARPLHDARSAQDHPETCSSPRRCARSPRPILDINRLRFHTGLHMQSAFRLKEVDGHGNSSLGADRRVAHDPERDEPAL